VQHFAHADHRRRHTVTETEPVREALDRLGADTKAWRLPDRDEQARRAAAELAEWIRAGSGPRPDLDAARAAKHHGLIAGFGE
jgi:hypothetical protein